MRWCLFFLIFNEKTRIQLDDMSEKNSDFFNLQ